MNTINIFCVLPSAPAADRYDGVSGVAFASLILIECMDAAQVGHSILDGRSAVDVGDRRSTFIEQRRLHPFLRTAERRLGSPDDPQTVRSIS